jgi:serine/threonine-protein kinase RsbW
MYGSPLNPIMSRLAADEFVDRHSELRQIETLAAGAGTRAILAAGKPHAGKTTLLRAAFDRFFNRDSAVAPFYYCFSRESGNPDQNAADYLSSFIAQFLAFRHRDVRLLDLAGKQPGSIPINCPAEDHTWVSDAIKEHLEVSHRDGAARSVFGIPNIAAVHTGLTPLMLVDDVHLATDAPGSTGLARLLLVRALDRVRPGEAAPIYVFSGLRRPLVSSLAATDDAHEAFRVLPVGPLGYEAVERSIRSVATNLALQLSDSTAELMVHQLDGDLLYARAILNSAASRGLGLRTFMDFERVYTDEVLNGQLRRYFDAVIRDAARGPRGERAVLEALWVLAGTDAPMSREAMVKRLSQYDPDPEALLTRLDARELLTCGLSFVEKSDDLVLPDYIRARYRREITGIRPPLGGSELLGEKLKHSYKLMLSRYNNTVESELVDALSRFEFQSVPALLLDNALFDERFRGMSRVAVRRVLDNEEVRIRLPQITHVSDAGAGEGQGMNWRLFVAGGFEGGMYNETSEVLWAIALINSREPLDLETLGRIDNRLESAVRARILERRHPIPTTIRWYIGKEGFSAAASERLREMGAHHSTYSQLDLLRDCALKPRSNAEPLSRTVSEFDLVIPIEDDSELIAARTAEQIARAAEFDQESINQIKTALIEACLNAAEHSESPDRRIYQHFIVAEDRLVIRVSNRGGAFTLPDNRSASGSRNRGRGLQIIRALMDEVRFENTDDGASLVMVKLLRRPESVSRPHTS